MTKELLSTIITLITYNALLVTTLWFFFSKRLEKFKSYWSQKFTEIQELRKRKEHEKLMLAQSKPTADNPVLKFIFKFTDAILRGPKGTGKSLLANFLAHFRTMRQEAYDKKCHRRLKYTQPDYLSDVQKLKEQKHMNVCSDLLLTDNDTQFTSMDFWPYFTQHKKAIENVTFLCDEIGKKFGKEQYQIQMSEQDPDYKRAEDSARFGRQDLNAMFIGTEQGKDNIWKPIRDKGYLDILMHGTSIWMTKIGKFKNWLFKTKLLLLPAFLTLNIHKTLSAQFGLKNKLQTLLKMLLPVYFLFAKKYYIALVDKYGKLKFKYDRYKVYFEFNETKEINYLIFTNKDIYSYNTRGHESTYQARFDENGNNKFIKEKKAND